MMASHLFLLVFLLGFAFAFSFDQHELLKIERENENFKPILLNDTQFMEFVNFAMYKNTQTPLFDLTHLLDHRDAKIFKVTDQNVINFLPSLSTSPYVTLLHIFSSKCPTCTEFHPIWEQITRLPHIYFVEFDLEDEVVAKTLDDLNFLIYGTPTVLVLSHHNIKPKVLYSHDESLRNLVKHIGKIYLNHQIIDGMLRRK